MDVTDVLRDRMQAPLGLQRMITLSLGLHAAFVAALVLAPRGLLMPAAKTETRGMTISLTAGEGPMNGGLTPIGGLPVQQRRAPDEPAKPEPVRPPAAKTPEMTVPLPNAKPVKAGPAPVVVKQAPDQARGRTPTKGSEVREGTAVAETRARGNGFGLSTGGGGLGAGMTLDVGDFCCPEYLITMNERILSNWTMRNEAGPSPTIRFTIVRDGTLTQIAVEKSSGNPLADNSAQRALALTRQLPPLPAQFPNPTLTVHLNFLTR